MGSLAKRAVFSPKRMGRFKKYDESASYPKKQLNEGEPQLFVQTVIGQ